MELHGLTKTYAGGTVALGGIDLTVGEAEFVSLLGPSGSGKSTTLRLIAGFERPTAGEIWLQGERVERLPPNRRPVNTVFQDYALFPHLSVRDNIAFGLKAKGVPRRQIAVEVRDILELVGLTALAHRSPSQLSGGERQRTALARALVIKPKLLLLDEPLGALDLKLRKQMQIVLMNLQDELGIAFLYVTHDQDEALTMSDRVAVMNLGHIVQFAQPQELYTNPASAFVAGFVGENNLLAGNVLEVHSDRIIISSHGEQVVASRLSQGFALGESVVVALRPEHLRLRREPNGEASFRATVQQSIFAGDRATIVIRFHNDDSDLFVQAPVDAANLYERGQDVFMTYDPATVQVFHDVE